MHNIKVRFRNDVEGLGCIEEPTPWFDITDALLEVNIKDIVDAFLDSDEGEEKRYLMDVVSEYCSEIEEYLNYIGLSNKFNDIAIGYNVDFHNIQIFADYLLQERKDGLVELWNEGYLEEEEVNTIFERSSNSSLNREVYESIVY